MIQLQIHKQLEGSSGIIDLSINLKIDKGNFIALTGQSGSGKTTLLRILAGLESSNSTIQIDDIIWQNKNTNLSPQQRKIGFVFQDYALFNNMTVQQNLLFVQDDKALANRLLEITQLTNLKDRMPQTLSGGQKQRVALCRAMMNNPQLLLLDEPLSALDHKMRLKLQNEIKTLHTEFGTTTIMVSHNIDEVYRLSDRILVLEDGKIIDDTQTNQISKINNNIQRLISGNQKFKNIHFPKLENRYEDLVKNGQKPNILFIGCSDSRVVPDLIVNSNPGDMFLLRNIGNFVPPYKGDNDFHGSSAAIEYAVSVLNVHDIIVCGHSYCGACSALYQDLSNNPNLQHTNKWLELGHKAKEQTIRTISKDATKDEILRATEKNSIKYQLENLLTYPEIYRKVHNGTLDIHGWYYKIEDGSIEYYDGQTSKFKAI